MFGSGAAPFSVLHVDESTTRKEIQSRDALSCTQRDVYGSEGAGSHTAFPVGPQKDKDRGAQPFQIIETLLARSNPVVCSDLTCRLPEPHTPQSADAYRYVQTPDVLGEVMILAWSVLPLHGLTCHHEIADPGEFYSVQRPPPPPLPPPWPPPWPTWPRAAAVAAAAVAVTPPGWAPSRPSCLLVLGRCETRLNRNTRLRRCRRCGRSSGRSHGHAAPHLPAALRRQRTARCGPIKGGR